MGDYFKGSVRQAAPGIPQLLWRAPEAEAGDEVKISSITEADAGLPNAKLHISFPVRGVERYRVDGQDLDIRPGEFVVLNARRPARIEWRSKEPIEGICLFLTEKTLSEVGRALQSSPTQALEGPFDTAEIPEFPLKVYGMQENGLGQFLQQHYSLFLRNSGPAPDWDLFYGDLSAALLQTGLQIRQQFEALPCLRNATRQELFRRISLAHNYLLDHFRQPVSLDDLSRVACLSKFHLIRLYRQVYGFTPHQHLLHLRIGLAKQLLEQGYSVESVAHGLSFSDRRAFAKVFKKMTGQAPGHVTGAR